MKSDVYFLFVQAISGKGVDRHLLGLKLAAVENNIELPEFFKDPAYTFSCTWRISTSQVNAFVNYFVARSKLRQKFGYESRGFE